MEDMAPMESEQIYAYNSLPCKKTKRRLSIITTKTHSLKIWVENIKRIYCIYFTSLIHWFGSKSSFYVSIHLKFKVPSYPPQSSQGF